MYRNKIRKAKEELDLKTSEMIFGIDKQPENTCPMFDKALDDLFKVIKHIRDLEKDYDIDLSDLEKGVGFIDIDIEGCRENAEMIRRWGQQWKDLAKKYYNKYGEL